jgi:hypothetical protein
MRRVLLAMLLLPFFARQGYACLNDTSVERAEQEFRSQYNQPPPEPAAQQAGLNPWGLGALCVGAGLASGSLIVAVGRRRRGAS